MKRVLCIGCFLVLSILLGQVNGYAGDTNIALGMDAVANGTYLNYSADHAFDGLYDLGTTPNFWCAPARGTAAKPFGVMVDFGDLYSVNSIGLFIANTTAPSTKYIDYNLYYLSDNTGLDMTDYSVNNELPWTFVASGRLVDSATEYCNMINDLGGLEMRALKYEVVGGTHWAHLFEMEVWGTRVESTVMPLTGRRMMMTEQNPVPEPLSATLVGIGLGGAALLRRRRARHN